MDTLQHKQLYMKKIAVIYEKDIYPEKKEASNIKYEDRITGKAIILDDENKIALVGNRQNKFLQLPGGGISKNEKIEEGIIRECLEEVGCKVSMVKEMGCIDDFRPRDRKHCINYCYIVRILGKKGAPKYTKEETRIGMYIKWVTLEEAITIFKKQKEELKAGNVTFYNTGFNIIRDFLFLEEAQESLKIYG